MSDKISESFRHAEEELDRLQHEYARRAQPFMNIIIRARMLEQPTFSIPSCPIQESFDVCR